MFHDLVIEAMGVVHEGIVQLKIGQVIDNFVILEECITINNDNLFSDKQWRREMIAHQDRKSVPLKDELVSDGVGMFRDNCTLHEGA